MSVSSHANSIWSLNFLCSHGNAVKNPTRTPLRALSITQVCRGKVFKLLLGGAGCCSRQHCAKGEADWWGADRPLLDSRSWSSPTAGGRGPPPPTAALRAFVGSPPSAESSRPYRSAPPQGSGPGLKPASPPPHASSPHAHTEEAPHRVWASRPISSTLRLSWRSGGVSAATV